MHGIKSIFVFNTGSSSVKISLLCPSATCNSSPLRILTAHAQRIGTTESTVDVTFSSKLVSQIMNGYNNDGNQNELSKNHSSLQLSTRSASNVLKSNHKERDYKTGERKVDTVEVKKPNMTHEDAIRTIVDIINKYSNNILSTVSCVVSSSDELLYIDVFAKKTSYLTNFLSSCVVILQGSSCCSWWRFFRCYYSE